MSNLKSRKEFDVVVGIQAGVLGQALCEEVQCGLFDVDGVDLAFGPHSAPSIDNIPLQTIIYPPLKSQNFRDCDALFRL